MDNLGLRCRAHNAYEAEQWFGPLFVREVASEWGLPTEARSAKVGRAWSRPSSARKQGVRSSGGRAPVSHA